MTTITPQQAEERVAVLPTPLQDALFSKETADIIGSIGEKFNFEDEAISDVAEVVGLSLLGFIHPDAVKQEISDRVETSEESLAGVTMQIQDRILNRFRGLLVNAFYSQPGNSPKAADIDGPMPIGEIPIVPAYREEIPVLAPEIPIVPEIEATPAPAAVMSVNFTAPSIISDILPAEAAAAPVSSWDTTANSPEVTARPQFMMEDIQAQASPLVQASNIPPQTAPEASALPAAQAPAFIDVLPGRGNIGETPPPTPETPPAPFIMREEAVPEPPMGDINIGSAFGVDSSDQFKKYGVAETPDKPLAAQVEFGNSNAVSAVDYSSFAPEGDVLPPPPPPPGNQ
jgi:hypothetical protein